MKSKKQNTSNKSVQKMANNGKVLGKKVKKNVKKVKNKIDNKIETKLKGKSKKHVFLILILSFFTFIAACGLGFCLYIMISAPNFDVNLLYKSSSSTIYDADMNEIATLGVQNRQNVSYDELPDVLVDAIVATEDSKFFQHNGIDLLRFSKAVAGQMLGRSDAGGGSTLTMQVVKNTYNGTVSTGIKGIIRKFTDIYMSVFKVEKTYTKQEIIEFYVNQPYLGSSAYGVEQASITYFGKSVGELNLFEAATIAGLFQAPSAYDPYVYPEKAESRRNQVLSLMVRHGYLSEEEADIAKSIPIESYLAKKSGTSSQYQGFIDTVVTQIIDDQGVNPYTTSMTIYSTMKKSKQDVIEKLYSGDTFTWKNDAVQCGIAVTDVDSGAIVAVGAGRNKTGELTYNYATDIKRHPGSTAKPIIDYGPAIEYAGWGTGTMVVDDTYSYTGGGNLNNVDKSYLGPLSIKKALAKSRNVPALQTFQATTQEQKYEFMTNLGITPELSNGKILESASIGAFNGVSPLELSAAYGAFARGGYYIEPYSYTKIVYNDTGETYTYTPNKTKAMSEETAFMINYILTYAVTSGSLSAPSVSGTNVASKTGTTSIDSAAVKKYGLSSTAIMDSWQVVYSPDYAIAFWYGYDSLSKTNYLTQNEGWSARRTISSVLGKGILEKNSQWEKPSGVVAVDIEAETSPTLLASDYTPDSLRSTEYFKKGTEPTEVSTRFSQLDNVTNLTYTSVGNLVTLSWNGIKQPDAINSSYLQDYFNDAFSHWSTKYYQKRLEYNSAYIGSLEYVIYKKNNDGSLVRIGSTTGNSYSTYLTDSASSTFVVKSSYTIFTANASSGTEVSVTINGFISSNTPSTNNDNTNNQTTEQTQTQVETNDNNDNNITN